MILMLMLRMRGDICRVLALRRTEYYVQGGHFLYLILLILGSFIYLINIWIFSLVRSYILLRLTNQA